MMVVTIWENGVCRRVEAAQGSMLKAVLQTAGCLPAMPCGGNGTCGKCRVQAEGALSSAGAEESALLGVSALRSGVRLACMARIEGSCTVWVDHHRIETLSWARMPEIHPDSCGYGIAADIGTTTIAMRLYDRATGALLAEAQAGNRQAGFGADVISRIGRAIDGDAALLTHTLREQLVEMATTCMAQSGASKLSAAVLTGNTTMLHFYEGLDASGIACAPFTPASLFGLQSLHPLLQAQTELPPCIGAYVGADIVCALLASEMQKAPEQTALLADIGTNGEIALQRDGRIYCCSTAAGPAFEGAGLHQGMRAAAGAVTGVTLTVDGSVSVSVLGGGKAIGICGSGALDAVAVMLRLGILDGTGVIQQDYIGSGTIVEVDGQPAWQLPDTEVLLTQKDIRQIQLAKAAVCAGIRTLLGHSGLDAAEIDRLYIAGGFGHSMKIDSAAEIGLIPPELQHKVEVIGNGALAGASMLLLDSAAHAQAERIQAISEEVELSSSPLFMELYVDEMMFAEE